MNNQTPTAEHRFLPYWRISVELLLAFLMIWVCWQAWMLNHQAISWAMAGEFWPLAHGRELMALAWISGGLALGLTLHALMPREGTSAGMTAGV